MIICVRPEPDLQSTISIGSRMAHVKDIESFYNFIGYVLLTAPDRFPRRDYLRDDEQMTLDKAFAELRVGIQLVKSQSPDLPNFDKLSLVLDDAFALYRAGEEVRGAHRLNDLESMIFKN